MTLIGTSVPLLLAAAAGVGIAHSILPDHWVPLTVIARTNRWSLGRTAKVSFLAALGHVTVSLVLGVLLAVVGLSLRNAVVAEEGHIVGGVLVLTGVGFLIWATSTRGHGHHHAHSRPHEPAHPPPHAHPHEGAPHPAPHDHEAAAEHVHGHSQEPGHHTHHEEHATPSAQGPAHRRQRSWVTEVAVPFGIAASPDLTILPVFLAASAVGVGAAIGSLVTFALATLLTFVVLTVAATAGGYQIHWPWLEEHGHAVSALVLLVIGVLVYVGL